MMKRLLLKVFMLACVLGMSVNAAWAGIEQIVGSLDMENPTTWFYVNLNAQVSNPGCDGATNPGQVWLIHTEAEETLDLDANNEPMCQQDENGDPIPDPNCSGAGCCLHKKSRKAVNPWIPNNPKPAKPKNPYRNAALFTMGYSYGIDAYYASQSEKTYPTNDDWTEEDMVAVRAGYDAGFINATQINPYSVLNGLFKTGYDAGYDDQYNGRDMTYPTDESWTAEENSIVRAGYDDGYAGAAYNNPYWFGYEQNNLMGDWDDYFRNGLNRAREGEPKQEPNWMEWGLPRYWATLNGYNAGYDWYHDWYTVGHYLNEADPVGAAKPTGFAPSVSLKGTALIYAPGFEDTDLAMAYVSTYAYFYGKVQENDGWYFTGWSYTEGESDLGGVVAGSAENDSIELRVLPASTAGESNIRNAYVYATFQPVRLSDYKVKGLINTLVSTSTTVVFDVVGERVSAADFTVSVPEDDFSAEITSCENNKVTVTVTYSGSADGEYSGNVTLASKSGCSQLTAPVYARVGADASNDATLYDGKTPTSTSGTLLDMIAAANNTDKIVVLNKNYESDLTVNAKATINFNGYAIQNLTVEGGEVTIAYSKYGSNGQAISVTGGKLILNGGEFTSLTVGASGIVEQNGATITGASTNNGTLLTTEGRFEAGLTSNGTLTINGGAFEGTTAITVSGGTANINKATISGTSYGIATTGGTTNITSKLVAVYGATNAVIQEGEGIVNLTNGKYDGATPLDGTINLQAGYFKVDGEHIGVSIPDGKKILNVLAGAEFAAGYRYFVGDDASSVGVCRIGTTSYATLEEALAYANNTGATVTIIMTNDYTLPAGYYTLPANATLIVPMSNEQESGYTIVNRVSNNSASNTDYIQPYEFRRLTFAKGVNMDVHGTIELTGTQRASDDGYAAMPHGAYGHLVMEDGSHMTLQNGSLLRAWGYMTGKGETDARRGSIVREQFQMGDWKGGLRSFNMLNPEMNPNRVFPITQYFIQNIESPVKYHPGAALSTTTSVSAAQGGMGITAMANDIIVVGVSGGDPAMFFMDQEADAENTWVRKWYDAEHDVQTYDVNSGAHIGSMVLDLGKLGTDPLKMNSGMFVLPITNNMKIHLLSGAMDFTQTTALLAGAEVEVDKESVISIYDNPDPDVYSGALYVYDADEWDYYACGKGDAANTKYTKVVKYSPSWDGNLVSGKPANGKPTVRNEATKPGDASVNVHGTFDTGGGAIYTTGGGANIFSSNEDAGTFIFTSPAPDENSVVAQVKNNHATAFDSKIAIPAKLKNGDGTYTETTGSIAGMTYMYRDGAWRTSNPFVDGNLTYNSNCFTVDVNMMSYLEQVCDIDMLDPFNSPMNEDVRYAVALVHAPDNIREYLLVNATAVQQTGYTISPTQYESLKTSYYAYGGEALKAYLQSTGNPMDLAASAFVDYIPDFEAQAQNYNGSYDFGSAVQTIYIKPQEWVEIAGTVHLQLAIENVSDYEALYKEGVTSNDYSKCVDAVNGYLDYIESNRMNPTIVGVDGNSDHTFSDAAGAGRLFILMDKGCQWWEVEKKDNLYHCIHPDNDTYYYWVDEVIKTNDSEDQEDWDITPAHWEEKRYTITWLNWDGTPIETNNGNELSYSVTYGTMAEFLGTNPTREANIDYTYDFTGWAPALGPVTSNVTYTATYTEKPRMYTIIFQNEGGTEIERHFLTHNEVPVCENVPTKVGHTLQWNPSISAVTHDTVYVATWLENPPTEYEVTFYNYDGKTVLQQSNVAVGAVPAYTGATPTGKPATSEFTYVFDHWSPALEEVSATSIKSYTAVYREEAKTYLITFLNEDNSEIEHHNYQYGETPVCLNMPTKANTAEWTYKLAWDPQIQTVMGTATYKADFETLKTKNKYTVSVMSNPSGACAISGAGIYDYNTSATAVTITITPNSGYTFTGWSDNQGGTNTTRQIAITGDINLVANFTVAEPDYTITWKSFDGNSTLAEVGQKANTATIYTGAIPTKVADANYVYTFDGWTTEANGAGTFYKNNMTPKATASVSYYAHFAAQEVVMEVGLGQAQNISEATTVNQLILNSNGIVSGQLTGNIADLDVMGACYYDLTGTFTAGKWYAVAVPWQVTAGMITANGSPLSWNSGNYLAYYDGSIRAAQGKVDACWKYVSNSDVLVPGRLYMLYLENSASLLRFPKKAGAPILNTSTGVAAFNSAAPADANWNGIANPAIFYAYLSNTGATVGQVFNADAQSYEAVALSNKLIVAKPIFVQATNSGSATAVTTPPAPAPARRNEAAQTLNAEYQVEIASYGRMQDRLFISANEDKEADTYTIGQDVLKFGVSDKVAQMWVNRYDAKLCMNTMAPVNSVAEFPLSIFAPRAGEYTIAIEKEKASEDHTLYLTYNGEAIWNLSEDAYTAELQKGTDANYGLRISVKNAPQTTTGMDEAVVDAQGETKKVLIDNQVFIIRGDKVYSIDGQLVK